MCGGGWGRSERRAGGRCEACCKQGVRAHRLVDERRDAGQQPWYELCEQRVLKRPQVAGAEGGEDGGAAPVELLLALDEALRHDVGGRRLAAGEAHGECEGVALGQPREPGEGRRRRRRGRCGGFGAEADAARSATQTASQRSAAEHGCHLAVR